MKLSVSLSPSEVGLLDAYVAGGRASSRSAAVQAAIALLRQEALEADYEVAFTGSDMADAELWETTVGDGLA